MLVNGAFGEARRVMFQNTSTHSSQAYRYVIIALLYVSSVSLTLSINLTLAEYCWFITNDNVLFVFILCDEFERCFGANVECYV
jgi:hypothetical protein